MVEWICGLTVGSLLLALAFGALFHWWDGNRPPPENKE